MMRLRPISWLIVGLILGLMLAPALGHLLAQPQRPSLAAIPQDPTRLVLIPATIDKKIMSNGTAYFIKDTKSGGCWLNAGVAMAVAPATACQ